MRLALCCLLSLLLLAAFSWTGEDGRRAAAEIRPEAVAQVSPGACESWAEIGEDSGSRPRAFSLESPPLGLDDGTECPPEPAALAWSGPSPLTHPVRAPAPRYVGPWLRVPQRPPSFA